MLNQFGQTDIQPLMMAMAQPNSGKAGAIGGLAQALLQAYMSRGMTVDTGQPGATLGTMSLPNSAWQPSGSMWNDPTVNYQG